MGRSLHCVFLAALLAGLLKHLLFSFLRLRRFQRPSVNHVEGLELGPLMCRQGLCSLKIGIDIRAGQAGVVGGAARSPEKRLAKASHPFRAFDRSKTFVEVEPRVPLHNASDCQKDTNVNAERLAVVAPLHQPGLKQGQRGVHCRRVGDRDARRHRPLLQQITRNSRSTGQPSSALRRGKAFLRLLACGLLLNITLETGCHRFDLSHPTDLVYGALPSRSDCSAAEELAEDD